MPVKPAATPLRLPHRDSFRPIREIQMNWLLLLSQVVLSFSVGQRDTLSALNFIPANHPHLQLFGRWDLSDARHPRHSWPGVQIYAEFTGTRIGVRMADGEHFYNVYLDGAWQRVFRGDQSAEADYLLAQGLANTRHTLRLTKRNCVQNRVFSFAGLLLDPGAELLPPPPKPAIKIEFLGDSFTVAEGNEATVASMPWEETFPVTNIDKGFAWLITRHFQAQYHVTARSGIGLVCDWTGDRSLNLPDRFDRALMDASEPKWDFQQWLPHLVVICLGLNDYSGLKDKEGNVSPENSLLYRQRYHALLARLRQVYPGVVLLATAAHPEWMRANVRQVVAEEQAAGRQEVHFAQFDYFAGGYVANGHPSVASHEKIAGQLSAAITALQLLPPR